MRILMLLEIIQIFLQILITLLLGNLRQRLGSADDARFQQEAKKAGLSLPEAKEALQTFRQLDWSNIKRDPKTAEPIEEQARLLPDGNVTVNPANLLDPEAYNAAVDAMDTTPEAKERAKAMRAELAAPVAEEASRAGNKPVWELVEPWLKAQQGGRVKPRKINTPKLLGMQGNPGIA